MQYIINFPKVYANASRTFHRLPLRTTRKLLIFFYYPLSPIAFLSTVIVWIVFTLKLSCYPTGISMMISDAHTHDETIEISSVKKDF